jgi:Ca2+-binding EF-hand superfamily protein
VVSFEEYSALHSEMLRWGFNAIDSDNDGSISANEWETFLKMHGVVKGHNKNRQS